MEEANIDLYTQLGTIEKVKASDFWDSYPSFVNGNLDFDAPFGIFRVKLNNVTERLYFSILDGSGNEIQTFQPLIEYPRDLAMAPDLNHYEIIYYKSRVYYREI